MDCAAALENTTTAEHTLVAPADPVAASLDLAASAGTAWTEAEAAWRAAGEALEALDAASHRGVERPPGAWGAAVKAKQDARRALLAVPPPTPEAAALQLFLIDQFHGLSEAEDVAAELQPLIARLKNICWSAAVDPVAADLEAADRLCAQLIETDSVDPSPEWIHLDKELERLLEAPVAGDATSLPGLVFRLLQAHHWTVVTRDRGGLSEEESWQGLHSAALAIESALRSSLRLAGMDCPMSVEFHVGDEARMFRDGFDAGDWLASYRTAPGYDIAANGIAVFDVDQEGAVEVRGQLQKWLELKPWQKAAVRALVAEAV